MLWEKEKLLIMSNFFLSPQGFQKDFYWRQVETRVCLGICGQVTWNFSAINKKPKCCIFKVIFGLIFDNISFSDRVDKGKDCMFCAVWPWSTLCTKGPEVTLISPKFLNIIVIPGFGGRDIVLEPVCGELDIVLTISLVYVHAFVHAFLCVCVRPILCRP